MLLFLEMEMKTLCLRNLLEILQVQGSCRKEVDIPELLLMYNDRTLAYIYKRIKETHPVREGESRG